MKTNGTRIFVIAFFLYFFLLILTISGFSQPEYDFTNGSLISGSDRQIGAQYRFTTVKPGVDAIVTITNLTGGLTLTSIDGGSGFAEALQPVINVPANSTGYAEMTINFVKVGTVSPMTMLEVPLTCIDVDGKLFSGLAVNEFDQVKKTTGMYVDFNLLGGELAVTFDPVWVTGTNTASIDYPGVDTLAKQAMFSTISSNVSQITVRTGAINNTTSSQQRLRSFYFKRFTYPNSYLAKSPLQSFRGLEKNKNVDLFWTVEKNNSLQSVIIEKSTAGGFRQIGQVWMYEDGNAKQSFQFTDKESLTGLTLYRLKMVDVNGKVEYSNILSFRGTEQNTGAFKVFPSAIRSNATANIKAARGGSATIEVVDYAGRILQRKQITVQEGNNSIQLDNFSSMISGNYVAVLKIDNEVYSQKIYKQ